MPKRTIRMMGFKAELMLVMSFKVEPMAEDQRPTSLPLSEVLLLAMTNHHIMRLMR